MLNRILVPAISLSLGSMSLADTTIVGGTTTSTVPAAINLGVLSLPVLELPGTLDQPEPPPATTPADPNSTNATSTPQPTAPSSIPYGRAGSNSLVFGFGYASDFADIDAGEVHIGYSHFLCDELEFNVELTGWYFDQTDDTGGINPGFQFRWHFLHADDYSWTVYGEAGIGLLFTFDNFPDVGTGFNFSPRAGVGATFRLNDDGLRLQIGARWQHFSNGRIEGDARNPGFDGLMGYVGIIVPLN